MPYDVVMPQLGMTMTEGLVVSWLKQPGDSVARGEPLFVVQTDKVDMDVESTTAGQVLEILLEPGQIVPVGTVIARIATAGSMGEPESRASAPPPRPQPAAVPAASTAPSNGVESARAGRTLTSPRARRLARDLGIDIALIHAETVNGRVVEADVARYAESRKTVSATAPTLVRSRAEEAGVAVRSRIAERMTESFSTIPHFYLTVLADASELTKLREHLLPAAERAGVRITYTDLMIKALALALRDNPQSNASWREGRIVLGNAVHIGVAAQIGERLLVPVVRDADGLTVLEVASVRTALVHRGRSNRLGPDDLQGASCTLSNLGAHRVDQFSAIINPPESAILAVGRIAQRPFVVDGNVVARATVGLTLSVDHRAIDGVAASRFLESIVTVIEQPYRLLLNES